MKAIFLRVIEADDKEAVLLAAIRENQAARGERFDVCTNEFFSIPCSPFAYWVGAELRRCFASGGAPPFEAKLGLKTDDDFRFIRLWFEVLCLKLDWSPLAKGGVFSPFYSDVHLSLNWRARGAELKALSTQRWGNAGKRIFNEGYYFRPGLTWPRRTQSGLALRVMPVDCIFADKGPAAFVESDGESDLLALLAVVNSVGFRTLVDLQMAFGSFEVGVIQRTPVPSLNDADRNALASLAHRAWSLKRALDTSTENSHALTLPALLQAGSGTLAERIASWSDRVRTVEAKMAEIQAEVDARCFDLYGIGEADRRAISEGISGNGESSDEDEGDADIEPDETEETADSVGLAGELVSWTVGVAFGRFDMRLATGARPVPPEPGPFDALPACSPGMLTGDDGLPLTTPPSDYPIRLPELGILVDDDGHSLDLAATIRAVFDPVFGEEAEARWQEAAALLAPRGQDLRHWLARDFFEFHLKRYSKSRRQAPIYWPLSSSRGGYTIWLYYHRFRRDTLVSALNDFAKPRLQHERLKLGRLQAEAGPQPTRSQRQVVEQQESLVSELEEFVEELSRVAPLWNPDLDDGVIINYAPLWRLIGHAGWRKSVRDCWDALRAGDYDWSHLAMHLWPERVVPRCAEDASLAIAHGLEEVFWEKDARDRWVKKTPPPGGWRTATDRLVAERTSPAVKSALESLLSAPTPGGKPRRGRRGKSDA